MLYNVNYFFLRSLQEKLMQRQFSIGAVNLANNGKSSRFENLANHPAGQYLHRANEDNRSASSGQTPTVVLKATEPLVCRRNCNFGWRITQYQAFEHWEFAQGTDIFQVDLI